MRPSIRFDVFGHEMAIARREAGWTVYYVGGDGKWRLANDIRVPAEVPEADLAQYLDDLCHEWASPRRPRVTRLG